MKKKRVLTARRGIGGFIQRHTALSLTLLSLLIVGGLSWAVYNDDIFQLVEGDTCDGTLGQEVNDPCDSSNPRNDPIALGGEDGFGGEDWETIWNIVEGNAPETDTAAVAYTFIHDHDDGEPPECADPNALVTEEIGTFPTRFHEGSKDISFLPPDWDWTAKPPKDKNELLHAFAAMYREDVDGHLPGGDPGPENVIYFGSDRESQNGDAQVGFWILKNPIGLRCNGEMEGLGVPGDILVITNFVKGGGVGQVNIYKRREFCDWDESQHIDVNPAGCDTGIIDNVNGGGGELDPYLDLLAVQQDCDFIGSDVGPGCGSVATRDLDSPVGPFHPEGGPETTPWDYLSKNTGNEFYDVGQYPPQTFFEGAINLDHPQINLSGCFSGFVAEARASQSLSANRDDFTLGNFETCGFEITKQVDTDPTKVGDTVGYTITITNTGIESLWPTSQTDTIAGDLYPVVSLNTGVENLVNGCTGELPAPTSDGDPAASCTITYDYTIQVGDSDPVDNIVTAVYNEFDDDSGTSFEEEADATTALFVPSIDVDKTGDALSKVGDDVDYTFTLSNTSSGNTPDLTCTATDTHFGVIFGPAVLPAGDTVVNRNRVIAAGDDAADGNVDGLVSNEVTLSCGLPGGFSNQIADVTDTHDVELISPDFTVTKSCVEEPIQVGASANFRIRIANTGDVPLELHIVDTVLSIDSNVTLGVVTGDGVCDELDWSGDPATGCYEIEDGVIVDVPGEFENNVDVTFTLDQNLYPLPNTDTQSAGDACTVEQGGATRTLGFWKTHGSDGEAGFPSPVEYGYTCHVARDHIGFPIDIGWKVLQDCEDVFGVFMANPGKNADGSKRQPKACSAKPQAAWVYLAATLNQGLDNGAALDPAAYQALYDALKDGSHKEIKDAVGPVNEYNESGDDVAIIDLDGAIIPNADPNGVRIAADLTIADCP